MSRSSLSPISNLFQHIGLYRPARWAFNKLFYSRAKRSVELAGTECVFLTPTRTIAEYVESLTGEETILRSFIEEASPSDIVWDVGAGFGLYSVFASQRVSNGSIFAFEPEEQMRGLLTENLARNGDSCTHVLSCALGDADATTVLYPPDTPNVGSSALLQRPDYRLKRRGTSVSMRRGDSLVEWGEATAPTIVKLDVEGAEVLALQGMQRLLRNTTLRVVYCEIHPLLLPLFGSSVKELEGLITEAGFAVSERYVRGREEHMIYRRQP